MSRRNLCFFLCVFALACAYAQTTTETESRIVKSVYYNASQSWAYFTADTGWGAPGCPGTTHAQIHNSLPGRKEVLAIVLMAKAQGKRVAF